MRVICCAYIQRALELGQGLPSIQPLVVLETASQAAVQKLLRPKSDNPLAATDRLRTHALQFRSEETCSSPLSSSSRRVCPLIDLPW